MAKMATAPKFVSDGKGGVKKAAKEPLTIAHTGGTGKKPQATEKQAPAAKPEPAATPAAETTKKLTYQARMQKLPPLTRVQRKIASTVLRFTHLVEEIEGWTNAGELLDAAKEAAVALDSMGDIANGMPADFKPARERRARTSHLQIGSIVWIRDKVAADYEGMIDASKGLEVLDIRKGKVAVKTVADNEKCFIARGHLKVTQDADADEEDEGDDEDGDEAEA